MYKDNENFTLSFEQNIIILNLGKICMKIKYLVFVALFMLVCVGCSEKKEETQQIVQKEGLNSSIHPATNEYDQFDLNELGVPPFLSAEKEFSAKWNYAGSKKVLKKIVDKICRTERRCASRIDSSAYRKNVFFILDSLAQNKKLDSLIADIERRDYEFSSQEQHEKRVKKSWKWMILRG